MSRATLQQVVKTTAMRFGRYNVPRLGASLAYYTLLSLAPLAIVVVAICGLVLSKTNAEQQLFSQAEQLIGASGAKTLQTVVDNAGHSHTGIFASIIAVITILFGASGAFVELRDSMNTIWEAPPLSSGVEAYLLRRLVTFGMVLALAFLMLLSLLVSALLGIIEKFFVGVLPVNSAITTEIFNVLISVVSTSALFAMIFKFVPDVNIAWEDVGIGALVTAVLFALGRMLLSFYMGTAAVGSPYGAAGSLVVLVVWVYYSAQIFFLGAVFTSVYAECCGSRVRSKAKHLRQANQAKAG